MEDYNKAIVGTEMLETEMQEEYYLSMMKGRARIIAMEKARKSKPSKSDVREVVNLLKDFGVKVKTVPDFANAGELDRWKRNMLRKA